MKFTERNFKILENKVKSLEKQLKEAKEVFHSAGDASYIDIYRLPHKNTREDILRIENGDCCVVTVDHVVPLSVLAQMITFAFDNKERFEEQIKKYNDEKFVKLLQENFMPYRAWKNQQELRDLGIE